MARKEGRGKARKKTSRAEKVRPESKVQQLPGEPADSSEAEQAAENHLRGILTRGEAAEAPEGILPPGATHEIIEKDEQGRPTKIVRRRFSIT